MTSPTPSVIARSLLVTLLTLGTCFAYLTDKAVHSPPNYYSFQPPALGGSYTDPVFGTVIKRVTDARNMHNDDMGGNLSFVQTEYSTVSPFNMDNTKLLLVHISYFGLYDGSGNFLRSLPMEINSSSTPRWSHTDPNILYYRYGNQLRQYNASTGAISTLHTFSEYGSISNGGETDISADGDHLVFAGDGRYVFVYELSTNTKGPVLDTGGNSWDACYITPNNNVTITWLQNGSGRYCGVELYDRNMRFQRQVTRSGGHMDFSRDVNGDEVLLWMNAADPSPVAPNAVVKVRLSDGQQTPLISFDWNLAVHVSGTDGNGYVFVETYAPGDPAPDSSGWVPYTNELLEVKLDGTEVRRLAHHRSRPFSSYNWQPRLAASRDGTKVVFGSNFGMSGQDYCDVYLMDLASTGITPPPTTNPPPDNPPPVTPPPVTPPPVTPPPVTPPAQPPASGTWVEQNDPAVSYSGTWFTNSNGIHKGGTSALAMDGGSRASLTFTGTGVSWIGYRDEWSGIANVYVDGALVATVDTYSSPFRAQAPLYTVTDLSSGTHTISVEATQTHSGASGGAWIWIDGFQVAAGTATTNPGTGGTGADNGGNGGANPGNGAGNSGTPTRFQRDDPAIVYTGSWFNNSNGVHSGGGARLAMDGGARATLTFTGTAVRWNAYCDEWSGKANVYIDNALVATVDTFSSPFKAQAAVFAKDGLAAGTHTITIEATQTRNSASGGSWVWIDSFDVIQ